MLLLTYPNLITPLFICQRKFLFLEKNISYPLEKRSHGVLSIVFPYAAIYRITQSGYLTETKKKTAPDGRLRQYYAITETGRAYLQKLLETYQAFFQGVNDILLRGERHAPD